MATTAVDVKELAGSFVFIADMPGLKHSDIRVIAHAHEKSDY
jgi:HSP20 family molecular chaperone IbpA